MVAVLTLLTCAAAAILAAPPLLSRAAWRTHHPRLALGLWCASFVGGFLAAAASLASALVLAVGWQQPGGGPHDHLVAASAVGVFAWTGLAAAGALASLAASRAEPMNADHRRTDALLTLLAASAAYRTGRLGPVTVVFVTSDLPLAVSLPGADPRIVVTSRMEEELSEPQLRAVIEHERAHLAQRHGWVAQLSQLNAACLPGFFGAREFERAARLLVELIADDAAARACGAPQLAGALSTLAALQDDESLLLRARRIAAHPPRPRRAPGGALAHPLGSVAGLGSGE